MSIEARRGCGYRKAGGLYLTGDLDNAIPVRYLPCCVDYPHSRGVQWVEPGKLLRTCADEEAGGYRKLGLIALMWVGKEHYSPSSFLREAHDMGISKRVAFIPKDLKPGDPVALAHLAAIHAVEGLSPHCEVCRYVPTAKAFANLLTSIVREKTGDWFYRGPRGSGPVDEIAGVFCLFRMRGLELVLPKSKASDPDIRAKCAARGVTIVEVPDKDKDHVPSGWKLPKWLLDDMGQGEFLWSDSEETGEEATE